MSPEDEGEIGSFVLAYNIVVYVFFQLFVYCYGTKVFGASQLQRESRIVIIVTIIVYSVGYFTKKKKIQKNLKCDINILGILKV